MTHQTNITVEGGKERQYGTKRSYEGMNRLQRERVLEGMSQRSEEYTSVEVVKELDSIKTKQRRKEAIYTSTRSQATGTRGYAT